MRRPRSPWPRRAVRLTSGPVRKRSRIRVDELSVALVHSTSDGVTFEVRPPAALHAAKEPTLPVFEGWFATGHLRVTLSGVAEGPFDAAIAVGAVVSSKRSAVVGAEEGTVLPFSLEVDVPLADARAVLGAHVPLELVTADGTLRLLRASFVVLRGEGPRLASLDLLDVTDTLLFDAPPRHRFDLTNPEEGFWVGTGLHRLEARYEWHREGAGDPWAVETRPSQVKLTHPAFREDASRREGKTRTHVEIVLDASSDAFPHVPPEGLEVDLGLSTVHAMAFGAEAATLVTRPGLGVRLRDPKARLSAFAGLSAVAIDFGTSASVAALYDRGHRTLLRLGAGEGESLAENPTALLVEDHERLFAAMAGGRFPDLVRVARGSHAAHAALAETPSAVLTELKSLAERVVTVDQSPQLRDRERGRDFLLDEARVRAVIRAYAYLLGRAINRSGQDQRLRYFLTHPAKVDERTRALLAEEVGAGLRMSIPTGIDDAQISVAMQASEPEAFAAEVCPELAAHPALEPLLSKHGELRFAVFDLGGGTLDLACGTFRPATPDEEREHGVSAVIETLQIAGDERIGGDDLSHELAFLAHQHPAVLPEMEAKEIPMMRPRASVDDPLVRRPHLYKRSLAARQNRFRVERELEIGRVKRGPSEAPRRVDAAALVRVDGVETEVRAFGDPGDLDAAMRAHVEGRVEAAAKLLRTMLETTPWGGAPGGDFREKGVVILLAGNASRSGYVAQAIERVLGGDLPVFSPAPLGTGPFSPLVLYDVPSQQGLGRARIGVSPKTAVALGALKIANREAYFVRKERAFSFFVGDLRGFPPKFTALLSMGAKVSEDGWVDFGKWSSETPLRVAREYEPGKMTSSDPRLFFVPPGLGEGKSGRLSVRPSGPEEIALRLTTESGEVVESRVALGRVIA